MGVIQDYHRDARRISERREAQAREQRQDEARARVVRKARMVTGFWFVCAALPVIIVAWALAGCGPSADIQRLVLVEVSATAGDLDRWEGMTPEERRASLLEAHYFAVSVAGQLGIEVPAELIYTPLGESE